MQKRKENHMRMHVPLIRRKYCQLTKRYRDCEHAEVKCVLLFNWLC